MNQFDLIIVGGGPSGSAAALFAARAGIKTLLVDKSKFPRDKTCGDALSGKSLGILRKLKIINEIERIPRMIVKGVVFSSPRGDEIKVRFRSADNDNFISGYVSKRMDFDNFLFQKAKSEVDLCLEGFQTTDLIKDEQRTVGLRGLLAGEKNPVEYFAKLIIGADGYKSFVSRKLGIYDFNSKHTIVAIRGYYSGVREMTDYIEIHYAKDSLPGYFWIFPLQNGLTNVGLGIRHFDVKKKKINLQSKLERIIGSNLFKHRFIDAKQVTKISGWNLPVGSVFRQNHSDGIMLVGDAAGLVDPFTGEGIGNALTSADIAIRVAKKSLEKNDFSKNMLSEYDRLLKSKLQSELKLSYQLQKIVINYPFLISYVIKKAVRNKEIQEWISAMVADESPRKSLTHPLTYLKILWS